MRQEFPLFDLVKQRPFVGAIPKKCPNCKSSDTQPGMTTVTLIGWTGPPEKDPNHLTTYYTCAKCGEKFVIEGSHGNYWVAWKGRVMTGFPSCYESYIYTCRNCGGDVKRMKDQVKVSPLMWGWRYACQKCGAHVDMEREYWNPNA